MSIPYELVLLLALIKAGVLWLILYLSAKDEADLDFTKLAIIAGVLMFAFYLEEALLKKYIGMWTTLPLAALVVYLLVQYCWVSLRKALPVAAIFVAVIGMTGLSTTAIHHKPSARSANTAARRPAWSESLASSQGALATM